ncbi:MAG: hypothetical protein WCD69_12525 [Xanthobacteraceae bacterium]
MVGGGGFLFGAFSWTGIGVVGGGDAGFSFGAFSCAGIGVVGGGDSGRSFGAFSWSGIGVVGGSDGGFFFWTGICVVGGGDGGFLFEALSASVSNLAAEVAWVISGNAAMSASCPLYPGSGNCLSLYESAP